MTEERKDVLCCLKWQMQKFCPTCQKPIQPRAKPSWYMPAPDLPADNIGTKNTKPRVTRAGRVYFVRSGDTSYIKVGKTSGDVSARVRGFSTGSPEQEHIVKYVEAADYDELEKRLHSFLHPYRGKGEWFVIDESDINNGIAICFDWIADALVDERKIPTEALVEVKRTAEAVRSLPHNSLNVFIKRYTASCINSIASGVERVYNFDLGSKSKDSRGSALADKTSAGDSKAGDSKTETKISADAKHEVLTEAQQADKIMSNLKIYSYHNSDGKTISSDSKSCIFYAGLKWYFDGREQYRRYCEKLTELPLSKANLHYFAISNSTTKKFVIMYHGRNLQSVQQICDAAGSFRWATEICMAIPDGGICIVTSHKIRYTNYHSNRKQICELLKQRGLQNVVDYIYDPGPIDYGHRLLPLVFEVYDRLKDGEITVSKKPLSLLL